MKWLKLLKAKISQDNSSTIVNKLFEDLDKLFELELENNNLKKQLTYDIPLISQLNTIFEPIHNYMYSEHTTLTALLYEYKDIGIVSEIACNRRLTHFNLSCAARDLLLNEIKQNFRGYKFKITSKDEPIDGLINHRTKSTTTVVMPLAWQK